MPDYPFLILIAEDCPVSEGTEPKVKRKQDAVHILQYEELSSRPYTYSYPDFKRRIHVERRGKDPNSLKLNAYDMRRSLLPKQYGWGIHFDENGKVGLVGCETDRYSHLASSIETKAAYRNNAVPFEAGVVYNRREDLHGPYGGQEQGGISTPADHPFIFLFTGDTGSEFGYRDEFRPDGIYWYTGEGQEGDMEMVRGNKAIRDHQANNKELYLFESLGSGEVRCVGRATYLDHHHEKRPDKNDQMRSAITFELDVETEMGDGGLSVEHSDDRSLAESRLHSRSLTELRQMALAKASSSASSSERRSRAYLRSAAIRAYVLKRAEGQCEGCQEDAPFLTTKKRPYLEPHHIRRLADGGPDHPQWVIALCPTCHRRVHYAQDGDEYNEELKRRVRTIEDDIE